MCVSEFHRKKAWISSKERSAPEARYKRVPRSQSKQSIVNSRCSFKLIMNGFVIRSAIRCLTNTTLDDRPTPHFSLFVGFGFWLKIASDNARRVRFISRSQSFINCCWSLIHAKTRFWQLWWMGEVRQWCKLSRRSDVPLGAFVDKFRLMRVEVHASLAISSVRCEWVELR